MSMVKDTSLKIMPVYWEKDAKLNRSLTEGLKIFYSRVPFYEVTHQPFIYGPNVDELLEEASREEDLSWAVVFTTGSIFASQFQIVQSITRFVNELKKSKTEILVAGHLMNKKGKYCGLHEQCFIVNLDMYRKLGKPKFGAEFSGEYELQDYEAGESIHDDYTPIFLKPKETRSTYKVGIGGWNLVSTALAAGLQVVNLPNYLRRAKSYLYPDSESEILNRNIERLLDWEYLPNPTQRIALAHLFLKKLNLVPNSGSAFDFKERSNCLFVFNTESLFPDPEWIPPQMPIEGEGPPLDVYSGPCSGFQDLAFLSLYGFHENTELIYFDINKHAMAMKERILRDFSGDLNDLPALVQDITADFPDEEVYAGVIEAKIKELLMIFEGDREKIKENWQKIRRLPKQFIHIDLLSENAQLFKKFKPEQRILLNVTDIFLAQNELTYGYYGMTKKFKDFHNECLKFKNLIFTGRSVNQNRFLDKATHLFPDHL